MEATTGYTCYARPGKATCGHYNKVPQERMAWGKSMIYCEQCGRTKHSSDLRLQRGDIDKSLKAAAGF